MNTSQSQPLDAEKEPLSASAEPSAVLSAIGALAEHVLAASNDPKRTATQRRGDACAYYGVLAAQQAAAIAIAKAEGRS